ncbi:enamelin [Echinops telfairi]|uniref:Enamelin n=1 Tax=Echinops telfairi TaxID=9371 RepID=A0ABM0IM49_ECHTE|nr:enamelin [Echinops telfairi]
MVLLQCRHGTSFPKLDRLVSVGQMKILMVFLALLGNSTAMPMQMPRMTRFSSKSEEMMRYGQFNFMNSPHMSQLGPMYGNGLQNPQLFPQYQMPMWPQPPPPWHPRKPSSPSGSKRQSKTDQTQETQKPTQPQPKKPPPKRPLKQSPQATPQPTEEAPTPQAFPPFNNGLFPYQQPPWQIPQRVPPGYGRPPISNEEGGNPYFGYFGYHGFGGRPPYYSEEMFEQDFEKPKEKDPPKKETPAADPTTNTTIPETNATQSNAASAGGSQVGNDTTTPGHGPGANPTAQDGVGSPPAVNASNQGGPGNRTPWGPRQPNVYGNYPNRNPGGRGVPAGRQWRPAGPAAGHRPYGHGPFYRTHQVPRGPRRNTFAWAGKQAPWPGNPAYRKAYASISRGNAPNPARNPANFRRKPQGPNKQPMGGNVAQTLATKPGTVVRNEKIQNPRETPLGPKERIVVPTKEPTAPWKNSPDDGVNKPSYKPPHSEGNRPVPSFNSIDQHENVYYPRGDSSRVQNADGQAPNQQLPKGIVLEPRKSPYESETNQPELKPSAYNPIYPEEIPFPAGGRFPPGRNHWTHGELSPTLQEALGRQEGPLPLPSQGSRGSVFYSEYNPYHPRENSPYLRSNTWEERGDPPNTRGQPENRLYRMNTPDRKEIVPYNEEDPIDPTGDEPFPRPGRWGEEESSFKGSPTLRHYESQRYASNQPKDYLPYTLENPSKPREDFPYGDFYPWGPDDHFPPYNTVPTILPPVESRGYYMENAVPPEESPVFPSWDSWDRRIQTDGPKERGQYVNRNFWDQTTNVYNAPANPLDHRQNQPYSSNSPAGLRKNPTWLEDETLNHGMQMTRLNSPDGEQVAFPSLMSQSYPPEQKEANSFHPSQRSPCCAGGATGPKDNPLALQDYTPSFGLALGENQDTSPLYTEGTHTKHARHIVSPTSVLPGQRNSSEKRLPVESQNPSPFRDDVATLRRNTPCSIKNQLDQRGILPFPQSKSTPCLKSDFGGDGTNIVDQMFEGSQPNERTADLTPEQLVLGTPDEKSQPEAIQSEVPGSEGERQQQRPSSIRQLPCFGSKLAKHHFSGTGAPSSNGRQDPFVGDPIMPTEKPNTLADLATEAPFNSANVNTLNEGEHPPLEPFLKGTDPEDQVQDCLLLQA